MSSFQTPAHDRLQEVAITFCSKEVHDWDKLDMPTKEWYIRTIIQLWKSDERVLRAIFNDDLN